MTQPLAEFSDYDGLRRALNQVREFRDIPLEDLDDLTGLPDRYSAKIFGPRPAKRIGMQSLGEFIRALGVKCIFVHDPEAWERISKQLRFKTRDAAHLASVRNGAVHVQLNRGFLRKIGRKGGANSRKNLSKKQRTKLAKLANCARNRKMTAEERRASAQLAAKASAAKRRAEAHCRRLASSAADTKSAD